MKPLLIEVIVEGTIFMKLIYLVTDAKVPNNFITG